MAAIRSYFSNILSCQLVPLPVYWLLLSLSLSTSFNFLSCLSVPPQLPATLRLRGARLLAHESRRWAGHHRLSRRPAARRGAAAAGRPAAAAGKGGGGRMVHPPSVQLHSLHHQQLDTGRKLMVPSGAIKWRPCHSPCSLPHACCCGPQALAQVTELASGIAMHAAGMRPSFLDRASVPQAALQRERQLLSEQAAGSGKAEAVVAKVRGDQAARVAAACRSKHDGRGVGTQGAADAPIGVKAGSM